MPYFTNFLLEGKEWSWSVVGMIAVLAGLVLRGIIMRDILRGIKIRNRNWYQRAQAHYQKRSLIGWICFMVFAGGIMIQWRFPDFFLQEL